METTSQKPAKEQYVIQRTKPSGIRRYAHFGVLGCVWVSQPRFATPFETVADAEQRIFTGAEGVDVVPLPGRAVATC